MSSERSSSLMNFFRYLTLAPYDRSTAQTRLQPATCPALRMLQACLAALCEMRQTHLAYQTHTNAMEIWR